MDKLRCRGLGRQAGLSIIELMIAMTIGLMLLAGLVTYFVNASGNQREMQRSAQQIENGRYALDTMIQDLHVAGFYGSYLGYSVPAVVPDSCDTATDKLLAAFGLPVIGHMAGSMAGVPVPSATCAAFLTAANLLPGSDILVVRYADSSAVPAGTTTSATATYVQANPTNALLQIGGGTTTCTSDALGAGATVTRKCQVPVANDPCSATCGGGGSPAADIRQLHVHVYFVAPCSIPAGGGANCTGANDDGGKPVPTLKRLELTAGTFSIVPIAEGVEIMKIEFAVDDNSDVNGTKPSPDTGLVGDSIPDRYTVAPSLADLSNAVRVRVDLLVRNPSESSGFTDTKTYRLGVDPNVLTNPLVNVGPFNDHYRRHVYTAETRVVNMAGRKESP